jgi:hypothetical protein
LGLLDSFKNRLSSNLKLTRLSFMTQQHEIIGYCQGLTQAERAAILHGIESQFKWQSVAQVAQAMFPSYNYGGGVSAEALDMVKGGQISGGIELMRQENQAVTQPQWGGMTPAQQAALSFAWMILKGMELREAADSQHPSVAPRAGTPSAGPPDAAFCVACGTHRSSGRYCTNCGARF